MAHGNRGRRPHNQAVPEAAAAAVVELVGEHYAGANHTHLTELLREREAIDLSRPTVRRILTRAGMGSPRSRRSPQHRFRRRRMPQKGMLVQVDGSHHRWLEERGPKLVLLLAVDDATGAVAQAIFRTTEDTRGYMVLLEGLIRQWGVPLALYSDRHSAFKHNVRLAQLTAEPTQFAKMMQQLGIRQIFALSPQAKGRVERMASTLQDRLITELRLTGASTIDQANTILAEFLPRFNARFSVAAEQSETAYRQLAAELSLSETISLKHTRKVARDNTVKYQWQVLQLLPGMDRPSYAGLRVEVLERADGQLMIRYHGERVDFQESPQPPSSLWGATNPNSVGSELQPIADDPANGHLNGAHRSLLDSLEPTGEEKAGAEGMGIKAKRGAGKPVRHSLHRTPTQAQRARWEAVQKAKRQGLSLRAIARKLGMSRVTTTKYALAESPPTKRFSAKERAKAEALAASMVAAD